MQIVGYINTNKDYLHGQNEMYTLAFSQFEENEEGQACSTLKQLIKICYKICIIIVNI